MRALYEPNKIDITSRKEKEENAAGFLKGRPAFFIPSGGEKIMRRLGKRGQSTLEYAIIWTAIVGAILVAATNFLKPAIEGAVEKTSGKITTEVEQLVGDLD